MPVPPETTASSISRIDFAVAVETTRRVAPGARSVRCPSAPIVAATSRGTRAVIGIISGGTLLSIGENLKGMYKMAKGTRGVNREVHAVVLWVTAKNGCQCAQDIAVELVGSPSTMIQTLNSYDGMIVLREKMGSK